MTIVLQGWSQNFPYAFPAASQYTLPCLPWAVFSVRNSYYDWTNFRADVNKEDRMDLELEKVQRGRILDRYAQSLCDARLLYRLGPFRRVEA